jgi:hypothetical protein
MARRSGEVMPICCRWRAQATKSPKVLALWWSLPASYQGRPRKPPPRTWAMAKITPRSRKLTRLDTNSGSTVIP